MGRQSREDSGGEARGRTGPGRELGELIGHFRFGMLVSETGDGELRSRPMTILERRGVAAKGDSAGDSRLTFATGTDGELAADLARREQTCLTLQDGARFVSLSCRAELSQDRARLHELWSPELAAWFPSGPDGDEVVLVDCHVTHAEFWDAGGFARLSYAVEAGRAWLTDDRMRPGAAGRHGEVSGGELRG
jgi:general stress protein 26